MRKRTLLSHIKAVKRLVLLTLILAAAFPATIREAKAAAGTTFKVKVTDGYLALRSEKAFDKGNEIGQLNTGDLVEVTNRKDATYWYAYVPRLDKSGYLDKNYIQIVENATASNDSWTVKVKKGYLALRSTAAYNDSNEIGRLNTGEAELLVRELKNYMERIGIRRILEEHIDFGVISPYRAQVHYLRHLLKKEPFFRPCRRLITVHTVDGFQGQERDVIMISLVRANEKGQIGFLRDLRRMNVAITRARMKLLILGEAVTLTRHPFYRELYEYIGGLR